MTVKQDFLVFGEPEITEDDIRSVSDTLRTCWIGTGKRTQEFENKFIDFKREQFEDDDVKKATTTYGAVATSSCTSALFIALKVANVGPGDLVLVPTLTFVASVNVIEHVGAKPIFVDCDVYEEGNVTESTIKSAYESIPKNERHKVKAVIVVHLYGNPCKVIPWIREQLPKVVIIEDCAHAVETLIDGVPAGLLGTVGCFSFYPTKSITTGEGGMLITTSALVPRLKTLVLHGLSSDAYDRYTDKMHRDYTLLEPGYKMNMTDIQASLGISQLARAMPNWGKRQALAWRYYDMLERLQERIPERFQLLQTKSLQSGDLKGFRHGWHLFVILTSNRIQLQQDLYDEGIGTGIHYTAVHMQDYYQKKYGFFPEALPNAAALSSRILSIPLTAKLIDKDILRVSSVIEKINKKQSFVDLYALAVTTDSDEEE